MCGIYFALRSGGEHRSLRLSPPQITVHKSNEGSQYLLYVEDTSKNHQGGLKQRSKRVKHFANTKNPSRCFVRLFQLYISKLSMECPQDSFYFKPLQKWSSSGVWFSKQPIGHNKLHTMMSTICSAAGIGGYKTNHFLRATSATRLYHQGISLWKELGIIPLKEYEVIREQMKSRKKTYQIYCKNNIKLKLLTIIRSLVAYHNYNYKIALGLQST